MTKEPTICFVTAGGDHPWAIANALADRFGHGLVVIEEAPESKRRLLMRRARSRGWINACGQLGTMMLIRIGKRLLGGRIARYTREKRLDVEPRRGQQIISVPSVNAPAFKEAVLALQPDLVFLAGCRLLTAETLAAIHCPVLNYHAGITPAYRGMNGGYWALANGDAENFGSTIHMVDEGIDTGSALAYVRCRPEPGDTILTYPYTLVAASTETCVRVASEVLGGTSQMLPPSGPSHLWQHPTIWSYLWTGVSRGVW